MKNRRKRVTLAAKNKAVLARAAALHQSIDPWENAHPVGRECGSVEYALAELADQMVKESRNPEGFDAMEWVMRWLDKPQSQST
jgi:hypothetical protein